MLFLGIPRLGEALTPGVMGGYTYTLKYVFWVAGLVVWVSGLVVWVSGLVFECPDLYLSVWTCI